MNKPLKIGIIGLGRFGRCYFKTFNQLDSASVVWVCSAEENDIKEALETVNNKSDIKTTVNYKDILNDKEVDAVAIITPGSTHYSLTKEALKSDKHVIVEKPLAFNSKNAEELIVISDKKRKVLMAGHLHLFNPGIIKLKADIKSGLFGKINYIHSFGAGNGPIRLDMSALWDYFPHDVSILLYLLDECPLSLSVNGASYINKGMEDLVTMDIKFPRNIFATAIGTWLYPLKKRELVVVGEKLYAVFDDYAAKDKLRYYDMGNGDAQGKAAMGDNDYRAVDIEDTKPLTVQLKHFLDCIQNNKDPLTSGKEALEVVKVLEYAEKSLKNNGLVVEVPK